MSRKTARRHVFALVFQFPFHRALDPESLDEALALYKDGLPEALAPKDAAFTDEEVQGSFAHLEQLDSFISEFSKDWQIERISKMDLALLRLGIYEMLYAADIPVKVSINEIVELAKVYGTDESPAFVNGVLGSVARRLDTSAPADSSEDSET